MLLTLSFSNPVSEKFPSICAGFLYLIAVASFPNLLIDFNELTTLANLSLDLQFISNSKTLNFR